MRLHRVGTARPQWRQLFHVNLSEPGPIGRLARGSLTPEEREWHRSHHLHRHTAAPPGAAYRPASERAAVSRAPESSPALLLLARPGIYLASVFLPGQTGSAERRAQWDQTGAAVSTPALAEGEQLLHRVGQAIGMSTHEPERDLRCNFPCCASSTF